MPWSRFLYGMHGRCYLAVCMYRGVMLVKRALLRSCPERWR